MGVGFWWAMHTGNHWVLKQSPEPPSRAGTFKGPFADRRAAQREVDKLNGTHNPAPTVPNGGSGNQFSGGGGDGQAIATDARRYLGHPYVFGGSPGTDGKGGWDCSSFVNWVLGHDFNITLPGGVKNYNGASHGPVVMQYATWGHGKLVSVPQAGDLCIWAGLGAGGHIGIATSATHMISALDPAMGTAATPIHGFGPVGVKVIYRQISGAGIGVAPGGCLPGLILAPFSIAMALIRRTR